jgi:hypothetical protein
LQASAKILIEHEKAKVRQDIGKRWDARFSEQDVNEREKRKKIIRSRKPGFQKKVLAIFVQVKNYFKTQKPFSVLLSVADVCRRSCSTCEQNVISAIIILNSSSLSLYSNPIIGGRICERFCVKR